MSESKEIKCAVTKNLGRYNICANDKQWCIQVLLPNGKWLSETWPEEDEPHINGVPPSAVVEMIEDRVKSYWISSRRKEQLEQVEGARPMFDQMDDAWARARIKALEHEISHLRAHLIEE